MFDARDYYLGLAIIVTTCVGILAATGIVRAIPSVTEREMANISACLEEDNAVACSSGPVSTLLERESGAVVMDLLNRSVTAQQCHYIGHVVGQQSFRRSQSIEEAIRQCNRACDSACIHVLS